MTERPEVRSNVSEKLRDTAVQIGTILLDLTLVIVWLGAEYLLDHKLIWAFPLESLIGRVCLWIFRTIFALSTLFPCLFFLYRDIRVMWMRMQRVIAIEAAELRTSTTASATRGARSAHD